MFDNDWKYLSDAYLCFVVESIWEPEFLNKHGREDWSLMLCM